MTYSPGGSGYPPAQGPGSFGAPPASAAPAAPAAFGAPAEPGPSKLPLFLAVGIVALGAIAFLLNFGPMFTLGGDLEGLGLGSSFGGSGMPVLAAVTAALLAGFGLLPKAGNYHAVVATLASLGLVLTINDWLSKPDSVETGWAFWPFLLVVLLQAVVAVGALLLHAGVITAPTPKPKFEQPYGGYGPASGPAYYGQPGQAQRPGYQPQFGGYPQAPAPGGYGAPSPAPQAPQGPATPPTGFPSFSPPPAVGSGGPISPSAPTQQVHTQPPADGPASS